MRAYELLTEAVKKRLDPKCWKGYKKQGTKVKDGVRVNNCVKEDEVEESGLQYYTGVKKHGKEYMKKAAAAGREGASQKEIGALKDKYSKAHKNEDVAEAISKKDLLSKLQKDLPKINDPKNKDAKPVKWTGPKKGDYGYTGYQGHGMPTDKQERDRIRADKKKGVAEGLHQEFDVIEEMIEYIADQHAIDAELVWEDLSSLTDDELYVFAFTQEPVTEDWQKANKRDKTDGMSKKAVNAYRRENPGSKLKTAVTTKPSKLKKGSKASKRRKSYCSRSRGQMKMHNISCAKTPDKAICKARRRWNC